MAGHGTCFVPSQAFAQDATQVARRANLFPVVRRSNEAGAAMARHFSQIKTLIHARQNLASTKQEIIS